MPNRSLQKRMVVFMSPVAMARWLTPLNLGRRFGADSCTLEPANCFGLLAQFLQGGPFYLEDACLADAERLTDFMARTGAAVMQPESEDDHLALTAWHR